MPRRNQLAPAIIRVETSPLARSQVLKKVTKQVTQVHIDGHPFLWLLNLIFARGPNVKEIRLIPRAQGQITESHWAIAQKHGAAIVFAYAKPRTRWKKFYSRHPGFKENENFFRELPGPDRELFNEMIRLELKPALITRRYLCLDGKPYQTLGQVGQAFGLHTGSATRVSAYVHATRKFFDPEFPCSALPLQILNKLRAQLERSSRQKAVAAQYDAYKFTIGQLLEGVKLGMPVEVPANLPVSSRDDYKFVLTCLIDGRSARLSEKKPDYWRILACRFGLDGTNVFRTWQEVGRELSIKWQFAHWTEAKSYQRLRQLGQ